MDGFLLQLFSGLATGSIYAAVGLALVMIYQSTHHINFAQGEMATFSTFIAWSLIENGMSYWSAFFLTVGIAFVGGLVVQRVFIRPVEKAPVLNNVIVFVGLLVIFNAMSGWIFDLTGSYKAAFLNGIAWNLLNLSIASWLFWRVRQHPH